VNSLYPTQWCSAEHAAACRLSIRLAEKQAQSKQLEAFQTMSAFFVHDLKNTASSLSLMLNECEAHSDSPAFRKEVASGIEKTVNHINDLVARLRLLCHGLTLHRVDTDLNEVVAEALSGFFPTENNAVSHELRPLPRVRIDPEKMRSVVTNLVSNAREAIGAGGRVHIETTERNGWAVLGVKDNGCGMSADFVKGGLFRPFQSTKKNGLGISLFQSKMIVEAHRGRIEVETEPGKGAVFRVLLPLARSADL
jgi:putative PEP-CTERM system histidine kinase